MEHITRELFQLQDLAYREFHSKLIPNVEKERIIGVRTPILRNYAKKIYKETPEMALQFIEQLPHRYYEENNLHGALIGLIAKNPHQALDLIDVFLPFVDNWATCDCFCPKVFAKHKEELLIPIRRWLNSDKIYTVRYAMGMLMRYYLDEEFRTEYLGWVADVHSEEYYLNMMRAWYFAAALAKQPEAALPWLTTRRLDTWTHNKTIQKAVESFRITPEMKQQLCMLRIRS